MLFRFLLYIFSRLPAPLLFTSFCLACFRPYLVRAPYLIRFAPLLSFQPSGLLFCCFAVLLPGRRAFSLLPCFRHCMRFFCIFSSLPAFPAFYAFQDVIVICCFSLFYEANLTVIFCFYYSMKQIKLLFSVLLHSIKNIQSIFCICFIICGLQAFKCMKHNLHVFYNISLYRLKSA